jgi:BirA family biotin operon repressor/biotin-[acetyl-CoA-carboxylase] ligase
MSWDAKLFNRHLLTRRFGRECVWLVEVDSTNRWLAENHAQFTMTGGVVIADHQTQGRGRRDRSWQDVAGASLLFSVLLKHPTDNLMLGWLALAPAVALAEVLDERFGSSHIIALKWPNDVQLNGGKLAGILGQSSVQGIRTLSIVGMGVNLAIRKEEFPETIRDSATSLFAETGSELAREILLAEILNRWEPLYDDLLSQRAGEIERRWLRFGPQIGSRINRHESGEVMTGRFEGLGDRGQLMLRDDQGTLHALFTGDLTQ